MKKTHLLLLTGLVLLLGVAMPLMAQSLLANEYYLKAQQLITQSQRALDDGNYDGSATLAAQAKELFAKSDDYVAMMTEFYRANGWLNNAKDRVAYAKSIDADKNFKDAYDTAVTDVGQAKDALDAKDYPKSTTLSKAALAVLANIAPVAAKPQPAAAPAAQPAVPPVLPKYYVVRLRLPLRDCFWRIAAYPFVYNDPWKWRLLYDANKNVIMDPANPNLIEVGQKLVIPPLNNETRDGDYDPTQEYPTVSSH
jgi:hypothetical protein